MNVILEFAHAKINLTLDVLGHRPDGYHEVEMVMQTLQLTDNVTIRKSPKDIILSCSTADIPVGEENLAWKAAKLMFEYFNLSGGVEIELDKHIPIAAGLAGGSSDAAAVVRGINRLWALDQSLEKLCEIGAKIGSDVPFCIMEGTAIAKGRGEILQVVSPCPTMWIVLVKPPIGVSTAEVYKGFNIARAGKRPEIIRVIDAINNQNREHIADLLCNVLESVTVSMVPEILTIKERMIAAGALNALMSGSGPTVFGIAKDKQHAETIAQEFSRENYTVVVTQTYNK